MVQDHTTGHHLRRGLGIEKAEKIIAIKANMSDSDDEGDSFDEEVALSHSLE